MYDAYEIPRARLTARQKQSAQWKVCTWCRQRLPLSAEFFHRDKNQKDGLCFRCKTCTKILAQTDRPIKEPDTPRMPPAEHARINALQAASQLRGKIRIAAKNAPNAAAGIVLDGRRLSIPIKVCSGCAVQYPATLEFFTRCNKSKKDGLSGKCKECVNKPRRSRRQPNRARQDK